MKTVAAIVILCLVAALAAADPAPETKAVPATPKQPATTPKAETPPEKPKEVETVDLATARPGVIVHSLLPESRRPFSFYVPKGYSKDKPLALLIECTGRGVGSENITRMWQVAEKSNTIVASPDTYSIFGDPTDPAEVVGKAKAWSRHGKTLDVPQVDRGYDDIMRDVRGDAEAIGKMVDRLQKSLSIDPRLIVLTGYSGGARSAYFAGIGDPKRYAGICIRSGQFHKTVMPPKVHLARKMPIQIVIGDQDMKLVLDQTADAEKYFKSLKFEKFEVERLPNSGHDNRPEAAGNFVAFLRNELAREALAKVTKRRDNYYRAGKVSLDRGETEKARQWLEKAAKVEAEHNLKPATATELLKTIDPGADGERLGLINVDKDLLCLHYDHAPDRDDGHSAAADRCVLQTLCGAKWIREHVVAVSGAYGTNKKSFVKSSDAVMDAAWKDLCDWEAADGRWDAAVTALAARWVRTLKAGGDVWVKEGGQSDITADLVRHVRKALPDVVTTQRIHVVQHSTWNERKTTQDDLAYTKAQTHYVKIRDANRYLNVQGGDKVFEKAATAHAVYGPAWKAAFAYYSPRKRLDFSDTGELLHILGLGELPIATFRQKFLDGAEAKP